MSYTILLIDRDPEHAESIRAPLSASGHRVILACDAAEAIEFFEREQPHLAVIDAVEAQVPAAELCQELKKSAGDRTTPIVILAEVHEDQEDLGRLLERYGCDQLIDKSVPRSQMVALFEALLSGAGRRRQEPDQADAAHDRATAARLLDSDELVEALERLDALMTHRAAGRVVFGPATAPASAPAAVAPPSDPVAAQEPAARPRGAGTPWPPQANRDVPSAGAFDEALEPGALSAEPRRSAPGEGRDIDEHLDSLFAGEALPGSAPLEPAPAPSRPAPVRPAGTTPSAAPAPRHAPRPAAPAASPAAGPGVAPALVAATVRDPAPEPSSLPPPPPRLDLRPPRSALRWLVAATAVVVLLDIGYLLFLREPARTATPEPGPVEQLAAEGAREVGLASPEVPAPAADEPAPTEAALASPTTKAPEGRPAPAAAPAAARSEPPATRMPSAAPSARSAASTAEARPSAKAETPSARAASPPAPSPAAAAKTTAAAAEQPAVRAPVAAAADDTGPADAASPASADTPKPELRAVAATPPVEVTAAPAPPVEPPAASAPKPVPDRDAVVLERHEPTWPARALRNAAGSEIVLRVQVGPDGRISRVVVERGPGVTELETAAISAVLRWRFDPAVRDGRPVESWTSLRFEPR